MSSRTKRVKSHAVGDCCINMREEATIMKFTKACIQMQYTTLQCARSRRCCEGMRPIPVEQ
eukprot:2173317-Ditylum_brightwellii.AAC.1